jgi:hypothetical protein
MNMDVAYAGPIAKTLESVGFLITLSFVMFFIIIVGCLCLKMYQRVFPKQNFDKEGMEHTSLTILGHTLKSSRENFEAISLFRPQRVLSKGGDDDS